MNKKGYGLDLIWMIFVLCLVVVILAMAQNGADSSTIDKAINTFNWSIYSPNITDSINRVSLNQPEWIGTILQITNKAIDFIGYSIFAVGKLAMQLAKDNPEMINFRVLFTLIIFCLIAPLIFPVFMVVISIILIIREWYLNRKERKEKR